MSVTITINGTPIPIPTSGDPQDWSGGVDAALVALATALSGAVGTYDVAPQSLVIDSSNPGSGTLPNLAFSTAAVRSAVISYNVYRTTNSVTNSYEEGTLYIIYNPNNTSGNKWEISRDYTGNGASVEFSISDAGALSYSTTALSGTSHAGTIVYSAKALAQS